MPEKPRKPIAKPVRDAWFGARPKEQPSPKPGAVGYRQPPVETRFRKGVSGNPKGRPKKDKPATRPISDSDDLMAALINHFKKPMTIREDGKTQEVARILAFVRNLERIAAGGSVRATETLIRMADEVARQQTRKRDEDIETWREYIQNYRILEKRGLPGSELPEYAPHPEDIIVTPGVGVRIRGHCCPESYALFLELKQLRDAMALKLLYDFDHFEDETAGKLTMAGFVVFVIDGLFPKCWSVGAPEWQSWIQRMSWGSKDLLGQAMKRAFAELGLPVPLKFPMPAVPAEFIEILMA